MFAQNTEGKKHNKKCPEYKGWALCACKAKKLRKINSMYKAVVHVMAK